MTVRPVELADRLELEPVRLLLRRVCLLARADRRATHPAAAGAGRLRERGRPPTIAVTQEKEPVNVVSFRDCDHGNHCDINKEANKRNWNNQKRNKVVVLGEDSCAASLRAHNESTCDKLE